MEQHHIRPGEHIHIVSPHERVAKLFEKLRAGTANYMAYILVISEEIGLGHVTLEEFGSSESELIQLHFLGRKAAVTNLLFQLRRGCLVYDQFIKSLRSELNHTAPELIAAIEKLRYVTRTFNQLIQRLRAELEHTEPESALKLEEFGSSEREIENFRKVGALLAAHSWADQLREAEARRKIDPEEENLSRETCLRYIMEHLAVCGSRLEEVLPELAQELAEH